MLLPLRKIPFFVLLVTSLFAPENGLTQILKGQIDQLDGTPCRLLIRSSEVPSNRAVSWEIVSGNRVLTRGESSLKNAVHLLKEDPEIVAFDFSTPRVNPGMVLSADLHFKMDPSGEHQVHSIRIRAADPFASIRQVMRAAGIALCDPRLETAKALETLHVNLVQVNSPKEAMQQSVVVLGEGNDWDRIRRIDIETLVKAGKWIIFLRPQEGSSFPLIEIDREVSEFTFGRWRGSSWFPDRLDSEYWSTAEEDSVGIEMSSRPKQILMTATKGPQVWHFAAYKSREGGGCIFVGVPIVAEWNRSPVPRELLAFLFARCMQMQADSKEMLVPKK